MIQFSIISVYIVCLSGFHVIVSQVPALSYAKKNYHVENIWSFNSFWQLFCHCVDDLFLCTCADSVRRREINGTYVKYCFLYVLIEKFVYNLRTDGLYQELPGSLKWINDTLRDYWQG